MITDFPAKPVYNQGGYSTFKFIPHLFITSFPAAVNHVISTAIITSSPWLNGYATYETLQFNEEDIKSGHGKSYRAQISGFIPGEYPELTQLLFEMEQMEKFVVQLRNSQGKIRIIGSPERPLEFSSVFSSGDQRSSAKGYTLKFTGDELNRAPFYQL